MKRKLFLVTTVPETFLTILKGQPRFLNNEYDVFLISSNSDHMTTLEDIAYNEGVGFFSINMSRGISPMKDIKSIFHMTKFLINNKPDVIHSFTPKAGLVTAISSRLAMVDFRIHTFTGLIFPTQVGFKKHLLTVLDWLVVKLNTHIVSEGKGVWSQLKSARINDSKFSIIGNGNVAGVDCGYFSRRGIIADIGPKLAQERVFLYVGRLNRDKGLFELVRAFNQVEFPAKLILLGAYDTTLPLDDETLRLIDFNQNIYTLGFKNDIRPYMEYADVLVLPSYREGFPNVLLQAGAMSLPAIVTDVPGSNEVIKDGYNGWVVVSKSIKSLYSAFEAFGSTKEETLHNYGNNARKNVLSKYERKYYYSELSDFYSRLS